MILRFQIGTDKKLFFWCKILLAFYICLRVNILQRHTWYTNVLAWKYKNDRQWRFLQPSKMTLYSEPLLMGKTQDDMSIFWDMLRWFFFWESFSLLGSCRKQRNFERWAQRSKSRVENGFSSRLDEVYISDQREKEKKGLLVKMLVP